MANISNFKCARYYLPLLLTDKYGNWWDFLNGSENKASLDNVVAIYVDKFYKDSLAINQSHEMIVVDSSYKHLI